MKDDPRPARVALLGEFSAGKSTLANVLLGRAQSPVKATATQMPALWYRFGTGAPTRMCEDGTKHTLPGIAGTVASVEGTRAIDVPLDAPILRRFDLLDLPGSSDPNMPATAWDAILPEVDIAIWCTPATQAWRQSEAAIWDAMPARLHQRSLLLLTRIDKVGVADRARVLRRIRGEASAKFRHILPVALLSVSEPPWDCAASGLDKVFEALDDLLAHETPRPEPTVAPDTSTDTPDLPRPVVPRRVVSLKGGRPARRRASENRPLI